MAEKFTAMQWAAIEGGHIMEPEVEEQKPFSFIKDMQEARLTRGQDSNRILTYTDCCERLYLSILMLEAMRQYPGYTGQVKRYAKMSTQKYFSYMSNRTDLHNFIYYVVGDDSAQDKLKDPNAAKALRAITKIDIKELDRYLRMLGVGSSPTRVGPFLIRLGDSLKITNTDYKEIRRVLTYFSNSTTLQRRAAITTLLFAARAKLRSSDLIDEFSKFVADTNLETSAVKDNEPTVSVPDLGTSAKDISLYRYLVGQKNVALTKKFLELAGQGKSISSPYVQAYLPAVKMIDDIVQAGPTYVQNLRVLHQRAKKRR